MKPALPDPPLRLRDDPGVSTSLRAGLARAAKDSAGYDVSAGLARFEAACGPGGAPADTPAGQAPSPPAPGAGTGASVVQGAGGASVVQGAGGASVVQGAGGASVVQGAGSALAGAIAKGLVLGLVTVGAAALWIQASSPGAPPGAGVTMGVPATATAAVTATAAAPALEPAPSAEPAGVAPPAATSVANEERSAAGSGGGGPTRSRVSARDTPPVPASSADGTTRAESAPVGAAPASAAAAGPASSASTGALVAEMENLSRVRALAAGDPEKALSAAADGDRRFQTGIFAEEREALAISALVRLGRHAEARARAEAFIRAHPGSPFVERIRKLTGPAQAR